MIATVVRCDGCGTEKQSTNHWYMVSVYRDEVRIYRWKEGAMADFHLCGADCVAKKLSEWMGGR